MSGARGLPVVAFAVLLPLAFAPPFEDAFKLPQHILILLCAAWLLGGAGRGSPAVHRRPEIPGLLAVTWLSALAGPAGGRAGDLATLSALGVIGWLLPAELGGATGGRVLPALALSGAVTAAYSVWQFAVGDPAGGVATRGLRPFSTMGNPDFLAAYLVAVFPWQVATWARTGSRAWGAAAGLTGVGLLIAQSRGAWLAIGTATVAAPVLARLGGIRPAWSRRMTVGAAVGVVVAAGFLAGHAQSRARFAAMFRTGHFDAAGRFAMWRASALMIADRPVLGHGPGAYGRIHAGYHARIMRDDPALPWFFSENAHNDPLQVAAETGVVGLGAACWWLLAIARLGWIALRRRDPDGLPVLLGLVATSVNAMFNFPWYLLPTQGWAWLAYAALAARHGPDRAGHPRPGPGRPAWIRVTLLLGAGLLGGRLLVANGWLKLAGDLSASGRWAEAARCAARADERWIGWEGRGRPAGIAAAAAWGADDFAGSERWARRALALDPSSPSHRHQLGLALARQGRLAEAEVAVRAALGINPRLAEGWHTLGNLAWLQRDRSAAAAAWRTALSLNPSLEGARQSLAALESRGGGPKPPR